MFSENTIKVIVAITGIVIIEIVALGNGIDGILLSGSIAVIAGLAGYHVREILKKIGWGVGKW